jgi:hypothetical protein
MLSDRLLYVKMPGTTAMSALGRKATIKPWNLFPASEWTLTGQKRTLPCIAHLHCRGMEKLLN